MLIIGIAGGSGSGKSTITQVLSEKFGSDITVIRHDDFYKAHPNMTYEEKAQLNYDCPEAFETDLMVKCLSALRQGKEVTCPVYDYKIHDRSDKTQQISPNKVLIIDGILVLENEELRNLMDIKIFVDTDADIRIIRRIKRDFSERKRSLDSVIWQYIRTVKPMHEKFVEPSKKYADIIIPEGGHNTVALEMLENRIFRYIHG